MISRAIRAAAFLGICLVASLASASALEAMGSPRLARGAGNEVWAAYQVFDTEGGDFFELHHFLPNSRTWERRGRYIGVLAGMAWGDDALWLAMRDGALVRHGDEDNPRALADDRRRLLDLIWCDDRPTALDHLNGELRLIHPGGDGEWSDAGQALATDPAVRRARLLRAGDELHLVWSPDRDDFSGGALRHLVRENRAWEEADPLPLGDVAAFTLYADNRLPHLAAAIPDPLSRDLPALLARLSWTDDAWSPVAAGPLADILHSDGDFAAVCTDDGSIHWLVSGIDGVSAHTFGAGGRMERTILESGPGTQTAWTRTVILLLLTLTAALIVRQARRSRRLSLAMPGRPADLPSRAAALLVDSFFASVGVAAYHIASGDVNLIGEFFTVAMVNQAFWINLGGLAFFMMAMEAWLGCTPGKWLMGLRVGNARGGPIALRQAAVRNLMRAADMFPVAFPGIIGAIVALLNPNRQRLGDMLAGTVVRRHCPVSKRAVILASASPRRRELLEAFGLSFRSVPADIDEEAVRGETPEATARLLAEAKAKRVTEIEGVRGEIVIAADTMVILDGETLGKPRDAEDAKHMLRQLSGRSHTVISGVTVFDGASGRGVSDVEFTEVEFRDLSEWEIERYVASGDPMDKAGAYGIQSGNLVKQVRGSLSNVAGLPMETLRGLLDFINA